MKQLKYLLTVFILASVTALGAWFLWGGLIEPPKQSISMPVPVVSVQEAVKPVLSGTPTQINFPAQALSVGVTAGYYDTARQEWTVSNDKAHYATVTSPPNNKSGNTFIYGHNRSEVFTKLLEAELGDTATITTENGFTFTYVLTGIHDTSPSDVSYLQPTEAPTLTVQTCSGPFYQYRRMLTFSFQEVV